jgi:hypothetical protein
MQPKKLKDKVYSRTPWIRAHDKVLRVEVGKVKDMTGHVFPSQWGKVARAVSAETGVKRSPMAVRTRALRLHLVRPMKMFAGRTPRVKILTPVEDPAVATVEVRPVGGGVVDDDGTPRAAFEALMRKVVGEKMVVLVRQELQPMFKEIVQDAVADEVARQLKVMFE